MRGLDLFSGIGGITKALEGYVTPIAYCENDRYAHGVLLSRMATGDLPIAPIWDDVTTLRRDDLPTRPEIIYGGFPCQDISVAGCGGGLDAERSGLFFEIARLVSEIRPQFVFLENVAAITVRGAERVAGEFCRLRYDCRWGVLSAADVGANHRRERWWLLAKRREDVADAKGGELRHDGKDNGTSARPLNTFASAGSLRGKKDVAHAPSEQDNRERGDSKRRRNPLERDEQTAQQNNGEADHDSTRRQSSDVADPRLLRPQERQEQTAGVIEHGQKMADANSPRGTEPRRTRPRRAELSDDSWWSTEPNVGRVAHEVPFRVDRLRGLGNAVVPAQAREAFERLMGIK